LRVAVKSGINMILTPVFTPALDTYIGGERPTTLTQLIDFVGERQLLLYDDGYKTSESFTRGIVYQIFVDRFKRSGRCGVRSDAILNEDWSGGIPQYAEYPGAPLLNNMFFGGDLYGGIYNHSAACKFYKNVTKNQPFDYMFSRCKPRLSVHTLTKTHDQLLTEVMATAAHHGASMVIDALDPVGTTDSRFYKTMGKVFELRDFPAQGHAPRRGYSRPAGWR